MQFRPFTARRPSLTGVRYLLLLHVRPDYGFDNFEWEAYRRSWAGNISVVEDASTRANAVPDAYAEEDTPPGPAFRERSEQVAAWSGGRP